MTLWEVKLWETASNSLLHQHIMIKLCCQAVTCTQPPSMCKVIALGRQNLDIAWQALQWLMFVVVGELSASSDPVEVIMLAVIVSLAGT